MASAAAESGGRGRVRMVSGINLALGLWLVIGAFVLATTQAGFWNDFVCGATVAILAAARLTAPYVRTKVIGWLNAAIGAWLVVAPYVLGYTATAPTLNDTVVGALLLIFGMWSSALPPASLAQSKTAAPTGETSSPRLEGISTSDPDQH